MYKKLFFILAFLCANKLYSQNIQENKLAVTINPLTEAQLSRSYSESDIVIIQANEKKLAFADYFFSKSFTILEDQEYSNEEYLLIDVTKYSINRTLTEEVEILDAASGIYIRLKSLNEIENARVSIYGGVNRYNLPKTQ